MTKPSVSVWKSIGIAILILLPVAILAGAFIGLTDPPTLIEYGVYGALGVCAGLLPAEIHERRQQRAKEAAADSDQA